MTAFVSWRAGYVTRNDEVLDENDLLNETMFYIEKYGEVLKELDRGGLKFPTDTACQWTFFLLLNVPISQKQSLQKVSGRLIHAHC